MNSKLSLAVRRVRSTLRTGVDTGSSFIRNNSGGNNQDGSLGSSAGHPSASNGAQQDQHGFLGPAASSPAY